MTTFPFGETVQLVKRTVASQDEYGDDVFTEIVTVFDSVPVFPRGTSVENQGQTRDTVFIGLNVVFPPGTVVESTDRVIVRNVTYEVEGMPFEQTSPFTGWNPGVVVALRDVTG
jgi:hypothetical protein